MKDWDDYDKLAQDAVTSGTAVVEVAYFDYELEWGKWHRSGDKQVSSVNYPYASYLMNKKWTLEEEFNNHLNRFQQVKVSFSYFI